MGEIYTASFQRNTDDLPLLDGAERVLSPTDLEIDRGAQTVHAGNGWSLVADRDGFDIAETWPHALDIARLAVPVLAAGRGTSAAQALPVYVRDDVARKPAKT